MTNPRTSIIIPTYNRAYIIQAAIKSVLAQTDQNWELIVVDDGSTDSTKQVVEAFKDQRIRYVFQQNAGVAHARNHGLSEARGEWIAYLDSDNELSAQYLATMHADIAEHPNTVFAVPRSHRILEQYKDGKLLESKPDKIDIVTDTITIHDIFMRTFHVDTNGLMHHRRVFDEGIMWDATIPVMEDWEFALAMGTKYPDGFLFVNEVLVTYYQRFGGDGVRSNGTYRDNIDAFEKIYQKHKNDPLMKGQTWYEPTVQRWKQRQQDFEAGKLPPFSEFYYKRP
ncbi:MAG TPA: glycosyltransferase family A protein [Candidatus Saccharimonadales bacterium]|nr:glycosyltransferase family A protein [Candidatus Saccharimonadales bacterium]